ncbi:hypothetical protein D3C85_1728880 [compost metagenome]
MYQLHLLIVVLDHAKPALANLCIRPFTQSIQRRTIMQACFEVRGFEIGGRYGQKLQVRGQCRGGSTRHRAASLQ